MTLTYDAILEMARQLPKPGPLPDVGLVGPYYRSAFCAPYGAMRIISDVNCLKETTDRLFPVSRHRSARIRKKLMRRFGGEFRKEPAMFKVGSNAIVCHPALYLTLQRECLET